MRYLVGFIFISMVTISCIEGIKTEKDKTVSIIDDIELDSIFCCRPNLLGCSPCGNYLITKKPITNQLFCVYLNSQENPNISLKGISYKKGKYTVLDGLTQASCIIPEFNLAEKFVAWVNLKYDQGDSSNSLYGNFTIPTEYQRGIIQEHSKSNNFDNMILNQEIKSENVNSVLVLIKLKPLGRSSGVEF